MTSNSFSWKSLFDFAFLQVRMRTIDRKIDPNTKHDTARPRGPISGIDKTRSMNLTVSLGGLSQPSSAQKIGKTNPSAGTFFYLQWVSSPVCLSLS